MKNKIIVAMLLFGYVVIGASEDRFKPTRSLSIDVELTLAPSYSLSTTPKNELDSLFSSIDSENYKDAADLVHSVSRNGKFTPVVRTAVQEFVATAMTRKSPYPMSPLEKSTGSASVDARLEVMQNVDPALLKLISEVSLATRVNSPAAVALQQQIDNPSTSPEQKERCQSRLDNILNK